MKLIEDIGIYKSCSYVELLFLFLSEFIIITTAALLMPMIPAGIGIVVSGIFSVIFLSVLASWYRDKKTQLA
jgi:hypothetical protein